MIHGHAWAWAALFVLGAYHGINPGMGWLFAVALGMQRHSGRVVWESLLPIAAGHALSIGLVVGVALAVGVALPQDYVRYAVAAVLLALGLYRLVRKRHPHWGGMQVGFRDLTIWSFLMATAHGAGLMLLPVLLGMSAMRYAHHDMQLHALMMSGGPWIGAAAVLVHTLGYLLVTGAVAFVVYEKVGLSLLRKAWVNLDMVWAAALIVTAGVALVIPVS
ncbi:MAG TPA: hypothetical protein VEJ46_14085 [Candidatus Acidoferrum sp.]|nr:hypothetical protein [Candidatus Acidoferrum sp.]